jgi:hypothetical protein
MRTMMFRETPDGVIAITQPSHAWISGQIVRAWGNASFGPVTPYEDVCLGAEQHDIGWLVWEQAPTLNKATGRPHSFREISIADHTAMWRRGTEMALAFGRYPALLASLHGTGLYAGFDFAAATKADGAIVRAFLDGERAVQDRLRESLCADRQLGEYSDDATIARNRGLVRTADRMSIAICTAMRDLAVRTGDPREAIVRQVPTADGETDLRMALVDGGMTNILVSPWPFAASSVRVACEGVLLSARSFGDDDALRLSLQSADRVVLSAVLRPER